MSRPPSFDAWEAQVHATARQFRYPPTPPIAQSMRARLINRREPRRRLDPSGRLAWALIVALFVTVGLLAVPEVRAAIRAFLRIGTVEFVQPMPAAPPALPSISPAPLPSPAALLDLAGETTLDDVRADVPFPIRLPTYPADLGAPQRVYLQDLGGPAVVLVWLDLTQPGKVRLSLQTLSNAAWAYKIVDERLVQETTVNGVRAVWVSGPHFLEYRTPYEGAEHRPQRLIEGHVLIWQDGDLTYRLETDGSLDEAVRIAESLQ